MSELSSTPPRLSVAQGTGDFCSAPDTFILNVTEGQIRTGNEPSGPRLSERSGYSDQAHGWPDLSALLSPAPTPTPSPHTLGPAGPLGRLLEAPSLGSLRTGLAPEGGEGLVTCELPPDADAFALQT